MNENTGRSRPNPNPQLTRSHADLIVEELPEPPDTFRTDNLDEWAEDIVQSLYRNNLIASDGQELVSSGEYTHYTNTYRVRGVVYDDAQSLVEERDALLPCGHSGVQNSGGKATCSYRGCEKKYDRDEL